MRIVILYNTCWYVYLLRRNLIAMLRRLGCSVFVVAPVDEYARRIEELGAQHIHFELSSNGTNPLAELRSCGELLRILSRIKPDAVLSYTVKCNLYAGLCKRALRFTQIANISGLGQAFGRTGVLHSTVKALYWLALAKTDHIFFQNREDLALCVENGLVSQHRSRVIPGSGVDLKMFAPRKQGPSSTRTFLIFGRLLPQKGFPEYLQAAKVLRREFGDRASFLVLGSPDRTRAQSMDLYRTIKDADQLGDVRYLGSTDDVLSVLHECDVVVLPSTYNEGVPRSLLEALACGKPIITTDWKGCRETVNPGRNGARIDPHDPSALAEAMRQMILAPDESLSRMGNESRALAEERFNEEVVLEAYASALGLAKLFRRSAEHREEFCIPKGEAYVYNDKRGTFPRQTTRSP